MWYEEGKKKFISGMRTSDNVIYVVCTGRLNPTKFWLDQGLLQSQSPSHTILNHIFPQIRMLIVQPRTSFGWWFHPHKSKVVRLD